jgi:antiviral helicase SKI2
MDVEEQANLIRTIVEKRRDQRPHILRALGLSGLPEPHQIYEDIERKLLVPPSKFPAHWLPELQEHWDYHLDVPSLLRLEPSPAPTNLSFMRTGLDGHVTGYKEVPTARLSTGLTSTSLERAPAPSKSFVRGKTGYLPFKPGGLNDILEDLKNSEPIRDTKQLRTVPPGFLRGLLLPGEQAAQQELDFLDGATEQEEEAVDENAEPLQLPEIEDSPGDRLPSEIDGMLPTSRSHLKPVQASQPRSKRQNVQKRDWAHVIDTSKPMTNFHKLVPDMARKVGGRADSCRFLFYSCGIVSVRAGHIPEASCLSSRAGRFCVCCCPYIRWEDCRR